MHSVWASELDALMADAGATAGPPPAPLTDPGAGAKLAVNTGVLKRAWESSQRVTKEDWWVGGCGWHC